MVSVVPCRVAARVHACIHNERQRERERERGGRGEAHIHTHIDIIDFYITSLAS